jgi:hypothetical protein
MQYTACGCCHQIDINVRQHGPVRSYGQSTRGFHISRLLLSGRDACKRLMISTLRLHM